MLISMATMFLAKRVTINIHRVYNRTAPSFANGVVTTTASSSYFSSNGNDGGEKSKKEGMGTTTDGKAPNVTMSHAADTSRDGLERAVDVANEECGDASKQKSEENDKGSEEEEDVAVGEDGTVEGQNQSSG